MNGRMGDTISKSIVPDSFSRTIEIEVIRVQIIKMIRPSIPGTKVYALSICGLWSMRMFRLTGVFCVENSVVIIVYT